MISAKAPAVQPPLPARTRARARALARLARMRRAEQVLGEQLACRRLLVPQHHQDDKLQLLERERVARRGESALEHHFPVLRAQDARLLEGEQKAAAGRVELGELARGEG